MSGRLVILPHKSWNVWNRDNREKVARDERLHREQQEELAKQNRYLLQEQQTLSLLGNAERLQVESSNADNSGKSGVKEDVERPFRLFEDIEKQQSEKLLRGNDDYKREEKEKILRQQKKDGVAPWAFGEGSIEAGAKLPWYLRTSSQVVDNVHPTDLNTRVLGVVSGNSQYLGPSSSSVQHAKSDILTVGDPALEFCTAEYLVPRSSTSAVDVSYGESKAEDSVVVIEDNHSSGIKMHKKKKSKEARKAHREHKPKRHHSSCDSGESGSRSNDKHSSTANSFGEDMFNQLRLRRLERERAEAKRSRTLLAHADIYGSPGLPSSYHSQYNPNLSRK